MELFEENHSGCTKHHIKPNLDDFICGAKSCLCLDDEQAVHSIRTGEFTVDDIFVDDWKYPVGAFHGSDGGSC